MTEKKRQSNTPSRLAPHACSGIANPLNMTAISGARCNRIAIDAYRCVRESRKSHAAYLTPLRCHAAPTQTLLIRIKTVPNEFYAPR